MARCSGGNASKLAIGSRNILEDHALQRHRTQTEGACFVVSLICLAFSPSLGTAGRIGRYAAARLRSALGVRWLLVLSVCLLALDHCESTTFAIFQRLQPRNQPKTLDSAQELPSNQKMSRKDLSAGNCRALKNSGSVQSITRVDWDTTCLPRHAVGQNNCLHS